MKHEQHVMEYYRLIFQLPYTPQNVIYNDYYRCHATNR